MTSSMEFPEPNFSYQKPDFSEYDQQEEDMDNTEEQERNAQDFANNYKSNVIQGIRQAGVPTRGPNSILRWSWL